MIYITGIKPRSLEAVHTHTHTHTSDLEKSNIININKKGNITLPCGYYDTG